MCQHALHQTGISRRTTLRNSSKFCSQQPLKSLRRTTRMTSTMSIPILSGNSLLLSLWRITFANYHSNVFLRYSLLACPVNPSILSSICLYFFCLYVSCMSDSIFWFHISPASSHYWNVLILYFFLSIIYQTGLLVCHKKYAILPSLSGQVPVLIKNILRMSRSGRMVLPEEHTALLDIRNRLSVSYALATSVKLGSFESGIEKTIHESRFIPEELAQKGRISLSKHVWTNCFALLNIWRRFESFLSSSVLFFCYFVQTRFPYLAKMSR
jgi:hypothetical protein